jgi:hypothetical protein
MDCHVNITLQFSQFSQSGGAANGSHGMTPVQILPLQELGSAEGVKSQDGKTHFIERF